VYRIAKTFTFSASHQLEGLPVDHPCSRVHGHNYSVDVELEAAVLDDVGMVFDYRRLAPFRNWLDDCVDHRHLNDLVKDNPTAEYLAYWFLTVAQLILDTPIAAVRVHETDRTVAEYRPATRLSL